MARLRVKDVADARGLSLTRLHAVVNKRLDNPVAMGTLRRYWYSTKNGKEYGEPIELVDLNLLGTVARALGVEIAELLNGEELGQVRAAPLAA